MGGFLSRFGQLLELDCEGEVRYYYNVTKLIDCIDDAKSVKTPRGLIQRRVFAEGAEPDEPAVFKDPRTAKTRIYVNDEGKRLLEDRAIEAGLTGLEIGAPT